MFSLVNKHEEFFDYLVSLAKIYHKGALLAQKGLKDRAAVKEGTDIELEDPADKVVQEILQKMRHAFILPIDREDFYGLICEMDDCIGTLQNVLLSIQMYDPKPGATNEVANQMVTDLVKSGEELEALFALVKNIDKNEEEIARRSVALKRLKSESNRLCCIGLAQLLDGEHDMVDVMKWRRILKTMENVADEVEQVANVIREVAIKYA